MHRVPLLLGLVVLAAGIAMVGFGIPINEFGLGNTLIDAGTTAIVGGLVLLGLWAATAELRRIAQEVGMRPEMAARQVRSPPRKPLETPPEPERAAAPEPERTARRVRPQLPADAGVKAAPEKVSPRFQAPGERERKTKETGRPEGGQVSVEMFAPARGEARPAAKTFDAIWAPERGVQEASEERAAEEEDGETSPSPAILKSGVISGMAYTLYTDGSIEAELRHGTVRFGSIDELRAYLASNPSG
jgi:hypothetical protein